MTPEARRCRWAFQKEKMFVTSWLGLVFSLETTQGRYSICGHSWGWLAGSWGKAHQSPGTVSLVLLPTSNLSQNIAERAQPNEPVVLSQPSQGGQTLLRGRDAFSSATCCFLTLTCMLKPNASRGVSLALQRNVSIKSCRRKSEKCGT